MACMVRGVNACIATDANHEITLSEIRPSESHGPRAGDEPSQQSALHRTSTELCGYAPVRDDGGGFDGLEM
jgi:hypothetical protein